MRRIVPYLIIGAFLVLVALVITSLPQPLVKPCEQRYAPAPPACPIKTPAR